MANLIEENMYSQVDEEGQQYTLMSEIIDHQSDGKALSKDDGFYLGNSEHLWYNFRQWRKDYHHLTSDLIEIFQDHSPQDQVVETPTSKNWMIDNALVSDLI